MPTKPKDPDFPEMLAENEEKITQLIQQLGAKYGLQSLKRQVYEYSSKLDAIGQLNRKLALLSEGGAAEEDENGDYGETVQQIMAATQDYYGYIGSLPDDLRRFFLLIANTADSDSSPLTELGELVGADLSLDPSPLLSAHSIRPKNYTMQIDAITNHLAQLDGAAQLTVGKTAGQPVLTTVTLDIPEHMKIEGGGTLSTYDKSILNGITSLLESGNTVFSVAMLYHAMTGRNNPSIDEALHEELSTKLEKMRRMMLTIDLTEENEAHFFVDKDGQENELRDLKLEGYLLPLNKVTGMINGKQAQLYQIIHHPPLYTYSKMKSQLATVKISLLSAPVNNNSTTIPLKTYLLQRIEMMRNQKNAITRNNILYESIYKELGAEDAGKTKRKRIRDYTTTILDYFVEQEYIGSYVEYKKGRTIAGINIYMKS